ncbi:MAG: UvrD-helicase domain-containing protein [Cyanobacteriota bacterium]|nr:UvrD-helicase domain-containing protein [Cyanobacteriota bacterium]
MTATDLNAIPLEAGVRLLEASAGTGKTFAIAHLVLRLVGEAGIGLRRLLVVTFTNAAAAELRDRIGRRLQAALAALDTEDDGRLDPVLQAWLADRRRDGCDAMRRLRGRLLAALEDLDAADITTIHGYASRCLRRRPLEAGQPPDLQIDPDGSALIDQVVHDYWQQQVLPLGSAVLASLAHLSISPALLRRVLRQLDDDPALELAPPPPDLALDQALPPQWPAQWEGRLQRFRQLWSELGAALEADLLAMAAQWKQLGYSHRDYPVKPRQRRGEPVEALLALSPAEIDEERVQATPYLRHYFHPGAISRAARVAEGEDPPPSLPQRPLLEAIADLVDGGGERLLCHAAHWGRAELAQRRARQGRCGYGQLLAALDPGPAATGPTPLLQRLAAEHAVALIDEFQDTDPVQWRILGQAFAAGGHRLLMVGDPKQAIYSFRGGDLDTYLTAVATAVERFDLRDNRRSSPALVEGLNRLLGPTGLRRSGLAVPPVRARSARRGPAGQPLQLLWLGSGRVAAEPLPSATAIEAWLPQAIAVHVQGLLEANLTLEEGSAARPLRAADLCLLVASHRQAEALRLAMEQQAIPSRLISQADVLASPAATVLQRLLDALADPADANRLRLLAATPLLAWDGATLAAAGSERWSALAGQLQQLAADLPRFGLLGVVVRLVQAEGMARLARGGRLLADLQQVAQLLQDRLHSERLGAAAAGDWLRRQRLNPDRSVGDDQRAHSERADDAVAVMTVHASKGLEFPVVICPYLWKGGGGGGREPGRRWQPPGGERQLDLHLNSHWGDGWRASAQGEAAAAAERERLAYVAVTRAAHRLVLAWGPVAGQAAGPLTDWLLGAEGQAPANDAALGAAGDAGWRERLEAAIAHRQLPMELLDAPRQVIPPWRGALTPADPLATGPVPRRSLRDGWGRASYSAWVQAGSGPAAAALADDGRDTADAAPPAAVTPEPGEWVEGDWAASGPLAGFPRGAAAGDCLHRILERLPYHLSTSSPAAAALVADELARAALPAHQADAVLAGLEQMRLTPFGGSLGALRPADLPPTARLNEMAFDLSLAEARAEGLAAAFADHPGDDVDPDYAGRLARLPIASRGYLTGSIDLVFCDPEGRWWVLDWKSNWLGEPTSGDAAATCGPRHYGQRAMRAVMGSHHYFLQAHLYLVALHRYLAWRLPHYCPEQHLGGLVYVFLRGTPGVVAERALPGPVPGMLVAQPPPGRLLALDRALGRLEVTP